MSGLKEPIIETCDEAGHKYYKEVGSDSRCPYCLAIGLQTARDQVIEYDCRIAKLSDTIRDVSTTLNKVIVAQLRGKSAPELYDFIMAIKDEDPDLHLINEACKMIMTSTGDREYVLHRLIDGQWPESFIKNCKEMCNILYGQRHLHAPLDIE